jgi:hypothetical protein
MPISALISASPHARGAIFVDHVGVDEALVAVDVVGFEQIWRVSG